VTANNTQEWQGVPVDLNLRFATRAGLPTFVALPREQPDARRAVVPIVSPMRGRLVGRAWWLRRGWRRHGDSAGPGRRGVVWSVGLQRWLPNPQGTRVRGLPAVQLVNAVMLLAVVTLWADTISMGIDVVDAG
jgi:hypothetical protein